MRIGPFGAAFAAGGGGAGAAAGGAGTAFASLVSFAPAAPGIARNSTRPGLSGVPLAEETFVTPVVRSTTMRSPRITAVPWVTTTLPVIVTVFDLRSNTPFSPVAV